MYGFGIHMGNEDCVTWTLFNKLFSQSCPSISHVKQGQKYLQYVFVIMIRVWNDLCVRSL